MGAWLAEAIELSGLAIDAVLFHSGRLAFYHADDEAIPFRPTPHFVRWVPLRGPDHVVLARPGRTPRVVRLAPRDYWLEVAPLEPSWWQDAVDLSEVRSFDETVALLGDLGRTAYVGSSPAAAAELGIPEDLVEPESLLAPLDWHRATKTAHEIALIEQACRRAADGHRAAKRAWEAGRSEFEIHRQYLESSSQLMAEVPFVPIVALDEKASVLHYQNKRRTRRGAGRTFLLDAGASYQGYASDITRTWAKEDASPEFRTLLGTVDDFQRELVEMVTPGTPYGDIQARTRREVARALAAIGVIKGDPDVAHERGVTSTFLPHGVGHHLGIQVHDVGGRQAGPRGGTVAPPPDDPFLRCTRTLEPGHVVTIEPGVYFIPMLLEALRASPEGELIDWDSAERLVPCGGIRIEDDVVCTEHGPRDLTRSLVAGPGGE